MKFLFDDESFSFETLRAAGHATYGGADLGEIIATARDIQDGDEDSWLHSWKATAERVRATGEESLEKGHRVSAREAFLRASNYYRTAEFFRRENPVEDPEVRALSALSRDTFREAATLLDHPAEEIRIRYEDTTLPGYLFLVDDTGIPRPTVVYTNGFDSTVEESYFVVTVAALRRGYNVLAYDGPGQGSMLREQKLTYRADWEKVATPVIDYALSRPEIRADKITFLGYSLGGYLVARAASFDKRIAALVLDDGVHDFFAAFEQVLPPFLAQWIDEEREDVTQPILALLTGASTQVRWSLNNGIWAMGASSYGDFVRKTRDYTLVGIADRITAPTLIMEAENDQFFKGQPQDVEKALVNAPATLVTLTEAEGAGEHCHVGALGRMHQTMFDWLDTVLAQG